MSSTPSSNASDDGFAAEVAGQQPHAIDRDLSTLIQHNYAVVDALRGKDSFEPVLPGTWARMEDAAIRAAGIDPTLLHDTRSGFDASLYRDASGAVVVAYAGSDEWKDWPHNFRQGLGLQDVQYDQAIALAAEAKKAFGDNVILTGQSLGGGLAAAASMVNELPAVTFNAAGVHDRTVERYGFDAGVLKREADQGLIRNYQVRNEFLTYLQEDSIPLKWAMPDAVGHKIELPDPDPLTFFERLVPGQMLMHRVDLHFIEAVMQAQDLAQLQVREREPHTDPSKLGDANRTSNRLLRDALGSLDPQRQRLGLENDERFFNATAAVAARARLDGLDRIDHLVAGANRGDTLFAVQGRLDDPAQRRSSIDFGHASEIPARLNAASLREQEVRQHAHAQPSVEPQPRPSLAW
ncbi:MAG: XVIPCD domain-containing protein [Pseudoxanthomonas sp.]